MNIIEEFGYEKCFEDEHKEYFRRMLGYNEKSFFGLKYISKAPFTQIFVFVKDKNREYQEEAKVLLFEPMKDLQRKLDLMKKLQKYYTLNLKEVVSILDSGKMELKNELEYEFMKFHLFHLGYNIKKT